MSLHDCIQRAIDSGDLPPARAKAAQRLFAERLSEHAHLGQGAEAMAAEDVWVALRTDAIRKRRGVLMQAKSQISIADALARHRDSNGQANAASAMRQLVEWGQSATHQSIAGIAQALESSYMADVHQLVATHKVTIFGNTRAKARLPNLVRELKGVATGDQHAKAMADAVRRTIERARREFNAAGGEIHKMEGFDLPHHWGRAKVAKVTEAEFVAKFHDRQDWARIVDHKTGQPFSKSSRKAREAFLADVHRGIRTGGWDAREPSGAAFGSSLGKSRAQARVLHFKSADDWLAMNEEFGTADPFSAIVHHLQSMARDTATMRILGPNPGAGLEYAKQAALKLAQDRPWKPGKNILGIKSAFSDATAEVNGVHAQTQRMLDMTNGAANRPEMDLVAAFLANGVRPFLVAAQLGGAMLSAVGDIGFMGRATYHVGGRPMRMLGRHFGYVAEALGDTAINLATMGKAQRDTVNARFARLGIISESASSTGVVQSRLMGEAWSPGIMQRLSEFTLRASGLTAWTDIARGVFKMETYGVLAENAGRAWDDLDPPFRDLMLAARGITPADWDIIRSTKLFAHPDDPRATFLIPQDIARRTDLDPDQALDLSLKLQSAIEEQLEFAVPTVSLRAKASVITGAPGTVGGELVRSAAMYKNYSMTLMMNQMGRVMFHKVRGSRAANIAMFATLATMGGAISIQLKEIAKGNDPRNMLEGRFWKAAALQGGGLGIFGDFIYASENRFGGGFAATAAGPAIGLASSTGGLVMGGVDALRDPDKMDGFQREAIRFANQFSGPTNVWYWNAAFDRLVWDNLQEWADGDAAAAFSRAEKNRVKNFGNESYWPRGQPLPSRLPDLSKMTGATP